VGNGQTLGTSAPRQGGEKTPRDCSGKNRELIWRSLGAKNQRSIAGVGTRGRKLFARVRRGRTEKKRDQRSRWARDGSGLPLLKWCRRKGLGICYGTRCKIEEIQSNLSWKQKSKKSTNVGAVVRGKVCLPNRELDVETVRRLSVSRVGSLRRRRNFLPGYAGGRSSIRSGSPELLDDFKTGGGCALDEGLIL